MRMVCSRSGKWSRIVGSSIWLCLTAAALPVAATDPIELDPVIVEAEQKRIAAVAKAMPSAVSVFVPGGAGGGSGVLISPDGYALTNFHVTSPAGSYMRCGLSDGNIYDAVIVGIDPVGDLAMIRLLGRDDFPYAEMADSRLAVPGEWCMVIGNPFLLASNLQPTVTWGILSGVGRYQYPSGTLLEYADCLQTDASINPGNSGGPLYDAEGRLLGIVGRASFEKRKRVNVGVGYAISINQAKNFLGYLRSGRIVDHASLGATFATDPDGGVRITNILETSDAYRRGLRYNSEVLELDGRVVQTANDLQNVLATLPSGWRVKMTFRERGQTYDTLVRLGGVHRKDELLEKMAAALPPPPPRRESPPRENEDGPDSEDGPDGGDGPDGEDGPDSDQQSEDSDAQSPREDRDGSERSDDNDSDDSGDGDDDREQSPNDRTKPDSKVPAAVAEQLVQRKGYANYHFNLQQQQAFIAALRDEFPGTASTERVDWVIEGETLAAERLPVKIKVGSGGNALVVGDLALTADSRGDMYDAVDAGTLAGLLPALDAWRRMIDSGPQQFGESYYLGEVPLAGERPLRHCLVGIDGEMEVRWLTHPQSRRVEAIEAFADRDRDPAELWVFRDNDDRGSAPSRIELRYGVETALAIEIKSWQRVPADSAADQDRQQDAVEVGDGAAAGEEL